MEWWLGYTAVAALSVAAVRILDPDFLDFTVPPRPPNLAVTAWNLVQNIALGLICIKRFNDCNLPRLTGLALMGCQIGFAIASHHGYFLNVESMSGVERLLFFSVLAFFFWSLYYNGFVRGTVGPNQYGTEPQG